MAMKKKFLGLAMAAMVALPATSAYAAPINMGENDSQRHEVTVTGTIKNKEGELPAGRIEVELPTAMQFTVNEDSQLSGANYTVNNTGSVPVEVSVSSFTNTDNVITVHKKEGFDSTATTLDRTNIHLQLNGNVGGAVQEIDLGDLDNEVDKRILTVGAGSDGVITLTGGAGTKDVSSENSGENVDKKGAAGNFALIFKIQKDK